MNKKTTIKKVIVFKRNFNNYFGFVYFREQKDTIEDAIDGGGEENKGFEQSLNSVIDPTEKPSTKTKQYDQEKTHLVTIEILIFLTKLFFYDCFNIILNRLKFYWLLFFSLYTWCHFSVQES